MFTQQWLETEFLGYLDEWESSVSRRTGFTPAQKKMMQLSVESLEGLRITGYICVYHLNTCAIYLYFQ